MKRKLLITLFLISTAALPSMAALQPIILDSEFEEVKLGSQMEILEDPGNNWKIEDVSSGELSRKFITSTKEFPGYGFTSSAYWVRFRVTNRTDQDLNWNLEVSYPFLDLINLYAIGEEGDIEDDRELGDTLPFASREMKYGTFVFNLIERKGTARTYYVRFESTGAMNLYLTMWSPMTFVESMNRRQIVLGIYYGAMLIMLMYNLFIFFSTWDRSYLYYVLYCMVFIVFQAAVNGLGYQYLWSGSAWWANHSTPFLILLSVLMMILFSRSFLKVDRYMPKSDFVLKILIGAYTAVLPASIFVNYTIMLFISIGLTLGIAIYLVILSVIILTKGFRSALLYIIAFAAFWVGLFVFGLKTLGVIPHNLVTRWMLQSASLLQVVLLSFGLADRINILRRELQELNVNLENIVEERTSELNSTMVAMERRERAVQKEFELAGNIQQGILPIMPFYHGGVKVDAYYKSMGKVGGDFFDIFHMKGGYLGILIADASGHGMPAAFITALAKISFAEAIQTCLFPADIFKMVNNELIETIKTDDFVTAFFVVISPTYDVFYGNASHKVALVLRKETLEVDSWDTNGLFMGAMAAANKMYEDGQDRLNYGDRILLYTDGINEAKNEDGVPFGDIRVRELLVETSSFPLEEAKERIIAAWLDFVENAEQTDDVTLVLIEIDPSYRRLIEYRDKGFRFLWQRRYSEAIEVLTRALRINPKDERSHLYIGECFYKNGNFSRSIIHLRQFLKNNEVDANVWNHLAQAYYNLGDYKMSYMSARKAAKIRNNYVDAMVVCGLSLKKLGRKVGAKKMFKRIIAIDKENEIARRELQAG